MGPGQLRYGFIFFQGGLSETIVGWVHARQIARWLCTFDKQRHSEELPLIRQIRRWKSIIILGFQKLHSEGILRLGFWPRCFTKNEMLDPTSFQIRSQKIEPLQTEALFWTIRPRLYAWLRLQLLVNRSKHKPMSGRVLEASVNVFAEISGRYVEINDR